MKILRGAVLSTVLISLGACAGGKDTILAPDGATIKSIYAAHLSAMGVSDREAARKALKQRAVASDAADLGGYVRDAFNELELHFPRLPNPSLVLYVFPHLSGDERVPVPGYATRFPMYTRIEYALPSDLVTPPAAARDE